MTLHEWAARWRVPVAALAELRALAGAGDETPARPGPSEAAVASRLLLSAPKAGVRLWRNNIGAMQDVSGRVVRYGLANESASVNRVIKSGDYIGVRLVVITPQHVGGVIGQFVSRETKAGDWRYTGTERERAQLAWANLINSYGGDAKFDNTGESL